MKKIVFVLTLLFVTTFSVQAATSPTVITLKATSNGSTINYDGTMSGGSTAVMCKLYNNADKEIDLLSSAVDNNKFDGQFTNVDAGTYNVVCADYAGGPVKKAEVVVSGSSTKSTANPSTFDAGIKYFVIVLLISICGVVGLTIYIKKYKRQ